MQMTLPPGGASRYPSPPEPKWPERSAVAAGKLAGWWRVLLVFTGVVLLALLGVALGLRPSPTGRGTHQQLGLPPCNFQTWVGVRCPSCGMTTAWAHTVRGELLAAAKANAGGTLLAIMSLVHVPWLFVSGMRGRWLWQPPGEIACVVWACAIVMITLLDWGVRVAWNL